MTSFLTRTISEHGYLAVFVLMILESACIPIPSEVIMLFGGALAGGLLASHGDPHVTLWGIALAGVAGNVVGSLVAYGVGRYGGRALIEHRTISWLVRPHHLDKADEFFRRRGPLAVGIGRVLPVVRTFVSLPAGIAEMPIGRFVLYTTLGCLPWTFALAAAGDAIGANWDTVAHDFTPVSIVIAVLLVLGLAVWWWRNRGSSVARARREEASG